MSAASATRELTPGEIELLAAIYAETIDYGRVRIHQRKAYFFQPGDTVMAHDGGMYFPPRHHRDDFSTGTLAEQAWFVHEGAHLYQFYTLRWNLKLRGLIDRRYDYRLKPGKRFRDYGLEQQGDIARDYFLLKNGARIRRPYQLSDYAELLPLA